MNRNPYLINSYLRHYLTAAILTMAVININNIADGMLMGNFLGPEALAAINISLPVSLGMAGLSALLIAGAAMLCARAIGQRDYQRQNRIFSVCMISMIVTGLVLAAAAVFVADYITDLLCMDSSVHQMVQEYVTVSIATCVFTILNSGLGLLLDVSGRPRMVTKAMLVSVIVNISCDVLYVYVLGGSIGFAALATATGFLASMLYMLNSFIKADSPYKFIFPGRLFLAQLKENIIAGIPILVMQAAQMTLSLIINYFIQSAIGTNGMFVVSVGITIMTVSFAVVNGTAMAFLSVGSMLVGEKDWQGVRMMFSSCQKMATMSVLFFIIAAVMLAGNIAALFGANTRELLELAEQGIPLFVLFIPGFALAGFLGRVYQVIGCGVIATFENLSFLVGLSVALAVCSACLPPEQIWYAFPLASVIILLMTVFLSEYARRRMQGNRSFLTLMPIIEVDGNSMDISIALNGSSIRQGLQELGSFCEKMNMDKTWTKINLCLEELIVNIQQHAGRAGDHYMDVRLVVDSDGVIASIHDDGKPFDPVHCAEENRQLGLKLLHANCEDMDYRYSFGQNTTILKWYK